MKIPFYVYCCIGSLIFPFIGWCLCVAGSWADDQMEIMLNKECEKEVSNEKND